MLNPCTMTAPASSLRASVSSSLSKTTDYLFISVNKIYLESITIKIYVPTSPTLYMFHASTFSPRSFCPHCFENNALLVLKVKGKGQWNKSESLGIRGSLHHKEMGGRKISYLPTAVTHSTSCGSRFMALRGAGRSQPGARLRRGRVRLFLRAPQELWGWARAPAALEENSHLLPRKARMGPRATLPPSLLPSSSSLFAYRSCTISKSIRPLLQTWTHPSIHFSGISIH